MATVSPDTADAKETMTKPKHSERNTLEATVQQDATREPEEPVSRMESVEPVGTEEREEATTQEEPDDSAASNDNNSFLDVLKLNEEAMSVVSKNSTTKDKSANGGNLDDHLSNLNDDLRSLNEEALSVVSKNSKTKKKSAQPPKGGNLEDDLKLLNKRATSIIRKVWKKKKTLD